MADDVVRRTPRPYPRTEDHHTPETAAQLPAGATNAATPVSRDAETGTGDLRVYEVTLTPDIPVTGGRILRASLEDDVDRVVAEHAALPECTACGGTGKDDHATVFEAPLAVHFAGPPVEIVGRRRQLCMWCGHVLHDSPRVGPNALPPWPVGRLVRVEDGIGTVVAHELGDPLPPGCCALPDEGEPVCICAVDGHPCPDCRDEDQADDGKPVDPDDGYPVDLCGKHTGNCSNRCLLPADHAGECDDDPPKPGPGCYPPADGWDGTSITDGPDEAQETRVAADWPAEPVDTHADEQEADRG